MQGPGRARTTSLIPVPAVTMAMAAMMERALKPMAAAWPVKYWAATEPASSAEAAAPAATRAPRSTSGVRSRCLAASARAERARKGAHPAKALLSKERRVGAHEGP
jgi:hypothetical protein